MSRIAIVGGGAAGFFAGITCAESAPRTEVVVLEKSAQFLSKVKISGGGRCNVTHACFDTRDFATRYPRGERALLAPFKKFSAADTVAWFKARGVELKTEADGRMFPTTDSSGTIIDCLMRAANAAGVTLVANRGVESAAKTAAGFGLNLSDGEKLDCDMLLLATGGCRAAASGQLAVALGHTLEPPVPSLFTFHIETAWLRGLAGVAINAEVSVPAMKLCETGAVLITHWGLSGPAILRMSAWGARGLHRSDYRFPLHINWLPMVTADQIAAEFDARRKKDPARRIVNTSFSPLPSRLWEQLVVAAGIAPDTRWSALSKSAQHQLVQQLIRTEFRVTGKSLNKDEFVTCGGVKLGEVDLKTMESRRCPGLFFAGELLDIDGITGGFNFQAAWTTGWLAGTAMAGRSKTA